MNDTSMPRLADTSGNCTAQLPSLEVIVSAPSHDSEEVQSLIDNQVGVLYSTLPETKVQDAHPRLRDMICDTLASVREPNGPPLEPYHGNIRSQDNAEFKSGAREETKSTGVYPFNHPLAGMQRMADEAILRAKAS
jgi:hypothetical protein